ncbi:MAG TPA: NTP transferase domain-containing protein [Anaerolineales bacterium]|jgi:GTP:adenosylcobinamide-phosphate guanylyltransferase
MDAIVTAGGIPQPDDPLYAYSKGDSKAMIDVAGKPMVQWVLDALGESKHVDNIIVIGLSPKSSITSKKPLHFISNQGRMLSNIVAGIEKSLELNPAAKYVLVSSADIPSLKPGMVDWLVNTAMKTKDDFYYGVVPREVMEKRFPNSKRTYTLLKDMQVCGADINIVHVRQATEHLDMWEELIERRKNPLSMAAAIGFGTAILLRTGQLTLADAIKRVCERIGIKGRAILWEHAEPGMDVDKPHQLELVRADILKQQRKAAAQLVGVKRKPAKRKARKSIARPARRTAVKSARGVRARTAARRAKPAARKTARKSSKRR